MDKALAMMFHSGTPRSWWQFAVEYATFIYNRTPMKRHNWRTPYEALTGNKPNIADIKVFGCGAYVFTPQQQRKDKLSPKSELLMFIGLKVGMKAYQFMNDKNYIVYSTKAVFGESVFSRKKITDANGIKTRIPGPLPEQHIGDSLDDFGPAPWDHLGSNPNGHDNPRPPMDRAPSDSLSESPDEDQDDRKDDSNHNDHSKEDQDQDHASDQDQDCTPHKTSPVPEQTRENPIPQAPNMPQGPNLFAYRPDL